HKTLETEDRSWQDWFNGGGNKPQGKPYPPVSAPHISQPFVSKQKIHGVDRGVVICVTIPVKDADNREVIGVLTGSMTWKEFSSWFEKVDMGLGKIVVFNQRGQAVMHRTKGQDKESDDVIAAVKQAGDDANPPARADVLAEQLNPMEWKNYDFDDPFQSNKGRKFLAAYKFFNPNDEEVDGDVHLGKLWGVIVEHDKNEVLKPVNDLRGF